jgi:thiol-disulfide isomerase/thioredoxin
MNSIRPVAHTLLTILAAFAAVLPASAARAAVKVGETIDLKLKTIDGQNLDSTTLKGKVVILDFWATWCGPCMEQVPHMAKINEEYGKKGVQIIGISLDQSVGAMKPVIQDKQMKWLHVFDGNHALSNQFAVNGIPHVFLFGPDMTLRWDGHPVQLDQALETVLKKYPPVLVDPKVLAAAQEKLADVNQKLDGGDAKGALKLMAKISPDASKDSAFAKDADETRGKLDAAAQEMLKAADADVAAGKYAQAAERLRELSISLLGLPVGDQAKKKLASLMTKPEAKKAVEAAQREAQASTALDEAKKLKSAKKDESAYPAFKQIAKAFAGTPSGDEAAAVVKAYESDAAFMKKINEKEASGKGKAALSMARSYAGAGRTEQAKAKYQSIIKDFAGTAVARTAQTELAKLPK